MRFTALRPAFLFAALVSVAAGCQDPFERPPAAFVNRDDTVSVYAITGTPLFRPSGYVLLFRVPVRLDQVSSFDFAFHIDQNGRAAFLPFELVARTGRTSGNPGLLPSQSAFEAITDAEQTGYVTSDTVYITEGQRLFARSAVDPGCFIGVPYYAKLEVITIDTVNRGVRFRIMVNVNCGYRGLQPGLPTR